jgi:hypothetical protein
MDFVLFSLLPLFRCMILASTVIRKSQLRGPVVVREINSSGPPIPIISLFCASRSTKLFQVVREPEKFENH